MKNLKAFFAITLSLVLILSFQKALAAEETTCEKIRDVFFKQYVCKCADDFDKDCSNYPRFDGNYCYYDCQTVNDFDVDCDSDTCICIKKTSCDSSKNNCYDEDSCTPCQGRKRLGYFSGSCETSEDCCQQPIALKCDSKTKLCYNPNNDFHCKSNNKCYSDEECMSNTCDINGTGECECSDRGEGCEEYYGLSSNSQCVDGRCNDDYNVCYDRDLDLAKGEKCYHDLECKSNFCDFEAENTTENQGRCVSDGSSTQPPADEETSGDSSTIFSKPAKGSSVCNDYCYYGIEPPGGTVCICNPIQANTFEDIINRIIDFIFTLSIAIVPLMIVWAGGLYVTSSGDEKKITTARNIITYTLSGLAIVLLSKGFVAIIKQLLGG